MDADQNKQKAMPHKIKVLHLIDSGGLYGAEKMLLALVEEQIKQGLEPIILSSGALGEKDKPLELEAIKLKLPLKVWRMKPGLNFREAWRILKWAKSEEVDVLHSHGYKFNILIGLISRKIRGLPLLITVHGFTAAKKLSFKWLYQLLDKFVIRNADRVVFVSKGTQSLPCFSSIGAFRKDIIYNGIGKFDDNTPVINNNWSRFFNHTDDNFVFMAVGRLSFEKGFDVLLDSFCELSKKNQNVRLVIFGEGLLRPSFERKIELLGIGDKVAMPGYSDSIQLWMKSADALVMPSLSEGMPITLIEGMSFGMRIVATNVGGIPELLVGYPGASLVDPGSVDLLQAALQECFDRRFEVRENFKLPSQFTKEAMADAYFLAYQKVCTVSL